MQRQCRTLFLRRLHWNDASEYQQKNAMCSARYARLVRVVKSWEGSWLQTRPTSTFVQCVVKPLKKFKNRGSSQLAISGHPSLREVFRLNDASDITVLNATSIAHTARLVSVEIQQRKVIYTRVMFVKQSSELQWRWTQICSVPSLAV